MYPTIALASASPRRRELLQQLGVNFELINANAQVNLTDSAGQTLPAGFAQAGSAGGETPLFDLQMAVQGFIAAAQTRQWEREPKVRTLA